LRSNAAVDPGNRRKSRLLVFPVHFVPTLILFNKPYGVLSQFTPEGKWRALAEFIPVKDVYVAGRLDADSEGLLILTDDGKLQAKIADPKHKLEKTYWAQVEGVPNETALDKLRAGVAFSDFTAQPAKVRLIDEPPGLWPRDPPIRHRAAIPTAWLEIRIAEGKNRQVRRMTAAIGYPTLRLIRAAIGAATLDGLAPGAWRRIEGGYTDLQGSFNE
jgi:23S rRNA pseudouridine2457 synthase